MGISGDITNKVVVLRDDQYRGDVSARLFKAEHGFGTSGESRGNAVFGEFLSDGERARVERYQIDRLATDEEVEVVKEVRAAEDEKKRRAQVVLTLTVGDVEDFIGGTVTAEEAKALAEEMADPVALAGFYGSTSLGQDRLKEAGAL